MLMHPMQSESLARSMIEDRHRVPANPALPRRAVRRTSGTALVGAAGLLQRAGRSLQGRERPPGDCVELRPCT